MKLAKHGFIKAAGALALSGGVLFAAALPAAAASPNTGYAASAGGVISAGPVGQATFPGSSPTTVAHANITGLLTTGVAHATAGPTTATSTVNGVTALLTAISALRATSVNSSCRFNTNTGAVTGSAHISNGRVTRPGGTTNLASNPAPNTVVGIPGIATITLNRQTTAVDGTLTVQAIHVAVLGSTQSLDIGVSVCNAANLAPVPILPGLTTPITLGAIGLLLLAGAAYQLSRRRQGAAA